MKIQLITDIPQNLSMLISFVLWRREFFTVALIRKLTTASAAPVVDLMLVFGRMK
jgi:hypothetical protein